MMAQRLPDPKVVYLHCRSIFHGTGAQLRQIKSIRRILETRRAAILFLTKDFSLDIIATVAKDLLQEGIFESTSKARLRFPEVFEITPAQKSERAASEAEAARSEALAIKGATQLSDNEDAVFKLTADAPAPTAEGKLPFGSKNPEANGIAAVANVAAKKTKTATSLIPSLYPIYVPYALQHRILNSIQLSLEECCFEFGEKWLPDIIRSHGWEVPEQVELTMWTSKLRQHAKQIPTGAVFDIPGESWEKVLSGTNTLRHSAVHRLRMTASGLVNLIEGAVLLTRMLKDIPRAQWIEGIRDNLKSSIEEMERHKKILQEKLSSELQCIAQRRAELDAQEQTAIKVMVQADIDHKTATGQWLTECLFPSGAGPNIESSESQGSSPKKSVSFDEKKGRFKKCGTSPQPSSSLLNTNTEEFVENFEYADEVLEEVLNTTRSLLSSIPFPPTRSSIESFGLTECEPSSLHVANTQTTEDAKSERDMEERAKAVETEVEKGAITLVVNEIAHNAQQQKDELKVSQNEAEPLPSTIEGVYEEILEQY